MVNGSFKTKKSGQVLEAQFNDFETRSHALYKHKECLKTLFANISFRNKRKTVLVLACTVIIKQSAWVDLGLWLGQGDTLGNWKTQERGGDVCRA